MRTLIQDVRFGLRTIARSPGFAVVAVMALALGIGANTAIFSVINSVLLRGLPYEDSGRVVSLYTGADTSAATRGSLSYPNLLDFREQVKSFEYVAAYQNVGTVVAVGGEEPERARGSEVTADLFPLLGAKPALGRWFTAEEDKAGGPPVVVISDGMWRRRFGSDPAVLGRELRMGLSGRTLTIIGVAPPGFKFPPSTIDAVDFYLPFVAQSMRSNAAAMNDRDSNFISTVAKLREGVTLEQASAEVGAVAARLEQQYPDANTGKRARIVPLHEDLVGDVRPALLVLLASVGLVLLIACANVANLLLARAASRSREMAIRAALGASRARVIRQLLTESVILSFAGGAAGLLLAVWGVELIIKLSPANVPLLHETSLDARVFLFTLAVSVLTGVAFGLAPALSASKTDLQEALKEGGRGGTEGARRSRVRAALVVSEIALSLVLLVGAGLLIKSFRAILTTDPGYSPERVLTLLVALNTNSFKEPESRAAYFARAIESLKALPGVEAAGATRLLPLGNSDIFNSFQIAGRPPFAPGALNNARSYIVSPEYFQVLGVPLLRGRGFTESDAKGSQPVIVINEALARKYFPNEEAIGQHLILERPDAPPEPPRLIVGVAGNVRFEGLNADEASEYYVPLAQSPQAVMEVLVRSKGSDAASLAPAARAALKGVDPNMLIWESRTMDELVGRSVAPQRFNVALLGLFAALALALASVGIYGVMSYTVTQRTHEIGIRMALGARTRDVLRMVVRQGMLLALIGVGVGLAGAFALTRLMSSLLYGVSATDPLVFASVTAILVAVALLACLVPARRATKVDPMIALRYE